MFNKVISTIGTRFGLALLNLVLLILTTKFFGPKGTGEVRLLMLNITIVVLFTSFVGGPNMVYLVPRVNLFKLVINSYWWALLMAGSVTLVLWSLDRTSTSGTWNLLILSAMQSITTVHHMVLVGKENLRNYNIITLLNAVLMVGSFAFNMFVLEDLRTTSFINALYFSSAVSLVASTAMAWQYIKPDTLKQSAGVIRQALKLGFYTQVGNIAQLLNYRFSYYLLEALTPNGLANVGVYSVGVQLSEALWIISKAIALVQYARISNSEDRAYAVRLTVSLVKVSFLAAIAMVGVLLLLPEDVYVLIFLKSFAAAKLVIQTLVAGIVAFAVSAILSPFFSGIGKHYVNTFSSLAGLVITLGLGLWLIPQYGLIGAGVTASASYIVSTIVQLVWFFRSERLGPADLLLNKADIAEFRIMLKAYLQSNKSTSK